MKKSTAVYRGLAGTTAFLMLTSMSAINLTFQYDAIINKAMGINTSYVAAGSNANANIYYPNEYGYDQGALVDVNIDSASFNVEMAEESMTLSEFYKNEAFRTYSRIPVYNEENDDYIKGYVLRQAILEKLAEDKFTLRLSDIVRPVLTFQETESVSTIWEKLLAKKEHISIIIDEYGCFRGIVTMEDVIETMLGTEIVDEKDTVTDMQEFAREKWQEQQQESQEFHEAVQQKEQQDKE